MFPQNLYVGFSEKRRQGPGDDDGRQVDAVDQEEHVKRIRFGIDREKDDHLNPIPAFGGREERHLENGGHEGEEAFHHGDRFPIESFGQSCAIRFAPADQQGVSRRQYEKGSCVPLSEIEDQQSIHDEDQHEEIQSQHRVSDILFGIGFLSQSTRDVRIRRQVNLDARRSAFRFERIGTNAVSKSMTMMGVL